MRYSTSLITVHIVNGNTQFQCSTTESLLTGMLKLGKKGIPVGCVNGGCGVCKVRILSGVVKPTGPVSRVRVSADEESQGYTLACRAQPVGDITLEVTPLLRKPFSSG